MSVCCAFERSSILVNCTLYVYVFLKCFYPRSFMTFGVLIISINVKAKSSALFYCMFCVNRFSIVLDNLIIGYVFVCGLFDVL